MDRLFILLESGSTQVTRRAAAKQIGEVQKLHPHELHNLLNRLIVFIQSNNWETRIAASQAVAAIMENVPPYNPSGNNLQLKQEKDGDEEKSRLTFEKFDLSVVLEQGKLLMGSEGKEFEEIEGLDNREMLKKQREAFNEKLGFAGAKNLGINFDEMVTLEDMTPQTKQLKTENDPKILIQDILSNQATSSSQQQQSTNAVGMSSREMNRAKRKARSAINRNNSIKDEQPDPKRIKSEVVYFSNEPTPDLTGTWTEDALEWPLDSFCSKLLLDLFSSRWEVRHGSATALRELLKNHIQSGGRNSYMSKDDQMTAHNFWLEDIALRLLCVIALDRFGDFVADQVVAPVRETSAQVLGQVMKEMPIELVKKVIETLKKFVAHSDWEVRHGAELGEFYN